MTKKPKNPLTFRIRLYIISKYVCIELSVSRLQCDLIYRELIITHYIGGVGIG